MHKTLCFAFRIAFLFLQILYFRNEKQKHNLFVFIIEYQKLQSKLDVCKKPLKKEYLAYA